MTEELPPRTVPAKPHMLVEMTGRAADAVSFDRILITGLLAALILILVLAEILAYKGTADQAALVLTLFKDLALILAGALANSVRHSDRERKEDS